MSTPSTLTLQLHGPGTYIIELTINDGLADNDAGECESETDTPFGFTPPEQTNSQDQPPPNSE